MIIHDGSCQDVESNLSEEQIICSGKNVIASK